MRKMTLTDPGPISAAFDLSTMLSDSVRERARRALAIVDRVHTDGSLPRVPIDHIVDPDARAVYRTQVNRGRTLGIGLDSFEPHVELALVHEIGHFLDHQALGNRGGFASARHPILAPWRQVVSSTHAMRQLIALSRAHNDILEDLLERAVIRSDRERVADLLRYTEVWARSYVQYVVSKSNDPLLARQLDEEQAAADAIQTLGFWQPTDFLVVRHAIDDVIRQRGWIDEHGDAGE